MTFKSAGSVSRSRALLAQKTVPLEPGQMLQHGLTKVQIVRFVGSQIVLRNLQTMEERFASLEEIFEEHMQRRLIPLSREEAQSDIVTLPYERSSFAIFGSDLSEASRRHAHSLLVYITELRKLGYQSLRPTPLLKLDLKRLKEQLQAEYSELVNFALGTIYEWSLRYDKTHGDPRSLVPNFADRGGQGHGKRLSQDVLNAAHEVFEKIRSDPTRKIRTFDVLFDIQTKLRESAPADQVSLSKPSWSTVDRMIKKEFSAYDICARNKGKAHANKQFRAHYPRDSAQHPLEVIEFDDKDTRTFLIDEITNLPIGRAYVTAGVDQSTTRCLGLSISHRHRSVSSALDAFRSSMLPKGPVMRQSALQLEVSDAFGSAGIAIFDNALYFHAKALETAISEASNSMCAWAKPYTPTEKAVVENFNGELVEYLLTKIPGFGGAKLDKSQLNDGLASATMGLTEFRRILRQWAFNEHPNKPRERGKTPAQLWDEQMRFSKPRIPANLDQFDAYFAQTHVVQLRPEGIRFLGLIYQNDRLVHLRRRIGSTAKVKFRYQAEGYLSRIFVFDPTENNYFPVASAHPEYADRTTLYQHRLLRKMAREQRINNPSLRDLLKARSELQQLIVQSRSSPKRHERIWANKVAQEGDGSMPHLKIMESITEVEYQVDQIDEVVLENIDENWDLPEDF